MKNAIVYSIHSNNPKIDSLPQWRQLRYSLDTLRCIDTDTQVKVYVSPPGVLDSAVMPYQTHNVEYIEFNADVDHRFDDRNLARWTSHKWISTFDALERFELDNALYVDGDTIWYDHPDRLFNKYGDSKSIYAKEDAFTEFIGKINVSHAVMNDGVNMVSKYILKYKDYILSERIERVYKWQEQYRDILDSDMFSIGIQWAACQYAISEAMGDIGNPVLFFDRSDVLLASEDMGCHEPELSGAALYHYLNYNAGTFLPKIYSLSVGSMTEYGKVLSIQKVNGIVSVKTTNGIFKLKDIVS